MPFLYAPLVENYSGQRVVYGADIGYADTGAGMEGDGVVRQVQQVLARVGFYRGGIDGVLGDGTRSAISRFQSAHRLPVSGEIDVVLLRELRLL